MSERTPPELSDQETAQEVGSLCRQEQKASVEALQEALHIDQVEDRLLAYAEQGVISLDMPLEEALEILDKRKLELIGDDTEDPET